MTFHVCTGLAGGTGSGSLIDVIAQIRQAYRDSTKYRILLYTLLPEENPKPNWDTGNYHSNGYAALLDLNALSVGRVQPHDLTGGQDRVDATDAFAGCYIFTNENANGLSVDVNRDIPGIAADFLYQKIVASSSLGWTGLDRIESGENGDSSAETDATGRKKERSKKFLAFGVKRLAIPEDEIREYLAYSFTRQAALQLAFNNWSDERFSERSAQPGVCVPGERKGNPSALAVNGRASDALPAFATHGDFLSALETDQHGMGRSLAQLQGCCPGSRKNRLA